MQGTLVKDWMTEGVVGIGPEQTLAEASALMDTHGIHRLPVTDDGRTIGILSFGDVRAATGDRVLQAVNAASAPALVRDLMTPDPITIAADSSLALAAQTMMQMKVSGLPVVDDDGQLIGMISASDLFRFIIATC